MSRPNHPKTQLDDVSQRIGSGSPGTESEADCVTEPNVGTSPSVMYVQNPSRSGNALVLYAYPRSTGRASDGGGVLPTRCPYLPNSPTMSVSPGPAASNANGQSASSASTSGSSAACGRV